MKIHQIIAVLAVSAIALPVSAAQGSADPKAAAQTSADQKKYCMQYEDTTGSRVRRSECKTKAQWAREGIEIDEPQPSRK